MSYCITAWGNTYKCHINHIILLQKKIVRLITFSHRLASTNALFKRLNILQFKDLYEYHVNIFTYKFCHGLLPYCFVNFFVLNCDTHYHNTRIKNELKLPFRKLQISTFGLKYNAPKIWNVLELTITKSNSLATSMV